MPPPLLGADLPDAARISKVKNFSAVLSMSNSTAIEIITILNTILLQYKNSLYAVIWRHNNAVTKVNSNSIPSLLRMINRFEIVPAPQMSVIEPLRPAGRRLKAVAFSFRPEFAGGFILMCAAFHHFAVGRQPEVHGHDARQRPARPDWPRIPAAPAIDSNGTDMSPSRSFIAARMAGAGVGRAEGGSLPALSCLQQRWPGKFGLECTLGAHSRIPFKHQPASARGAVHALAIADCGGTQPTIPSFDRVDMMRQRCRSARQRSRPAPM